MDAMILNLTMSALITSVVINAVQFLVSDRVLRDIHRANRWAEHGLDLLAVLRSLEWVGHSRWGGQCTDCRGYERDDGHADGCKLEAVIKAVEGRS